MEMGEMGMGSVKATWVGGIGLRLGENELCWSGGLNTQGETAGSGTPDRSGVPESLLL